MSHLPADIHRRLDGAPALAAPAAVDADGVQPPPLSQSHGHVRPRPDGVKARCGGPAMCRACQQERAALAAPAAQVAPAAVVGDADWVSQNVSGNPALLQAMRNHASQPAPAPLFLYRVAGAAPAAPVVQPGWQWVPVEPTPAMLDSLRTGSRRDYPSDELCRVRYVAMLAAAPQPQVPKA